jgi:hypothetical protein
MKQYSVWLNSSAVVSAENEAEAISKARIQFLKMLVNELVQNETLEPYLVEESDEF